MKLKSAYLRDYFCDNNLTQLQFAENVGVSERALRSWLKDEADGNLQASYTPSHKKICDYLGIAHDFFDALVNYEKACMLAWNALSESSQRNFGTLDAISTDVATYAGANVLSPALQRLGQWVEDPAELDKIERLVKFLCSYVIEPDHQLSINVDSSEVIKLKGVARDFIPRMLVHLRHATTMGPPDISVEQDKGNWNIKSSPHTHYLNVVVAPESDDEEDFEREASRMLADADFRESALQQHERQHPLRLTESVSETSTKSRYEEFDEIIKYRRTRADHIMALASPKVSEAAVEAIKTRLPSVRLFRFDTGTPKDILQLKESTVVAMLKTCLSDIEKCRNQLLNTSQGELNTMNKGPTQNIFYGPSINSYGKKSKVVQHNHSGVDINELRVALRSVAAELFDKKHDELARELREISESSDAEAMKSWLGSKVDVIRNSLGDSANLVTVLTYFGLMAGVV